MQVFFALVILTGFSWVFGLFLVQLRPTTAWQKAGLRASMLDLCSACPPFAKPQNVIGKHRAAVFDLTGKKITKILFRYLNALYGN